MNGSNRMCVGKTIWLILPVVICFFQGLSHASVPEYMGTKNGSVNGSLHQQYSKAHGVGVRGVALAALCMLTAHRHSHLNWTANTWKLVPPLTQHLVQWAARPAGPGVGGVHPADTKTGARKGSLHG